jgi:SHS2 domain-containing protein
VRYALPQPYREVPHTADVGVEVDGASPEEALARLVLAFAALLAGGGAVEVEREEIVSVEANGDPARAAVTLLRELLFRFATERLIPAACEVRRLDGRGAELAVGFGRWDPVRHAEGADVKAVTWHAARFERAGEAWRARVLFDI